MTLYYVDIDECLEELDDCDQFCVNSDGGYLCSCEVNFHFDDSSRTCVLDQNGKLIVIMCRSHTII